MLAPPSLRVAMAVVVAAAVVVVVVVRAAHAPAVSAAPATVVVDSADDSYDGSCADGDCSLRDAVRSAPTGSTVQVPPGFYPLTRTGTGGIGVGTIELRRRVEIVGSGETGAFIDASALGAPAFTASPRAGTRVFRLEGLTVFGARDAGIVGGAIRVEGGRVRLVGATLIRSLAARGGAVAVDPGGALDVVETLIIGNRAISGGGGIWNAGAVSVTDSAIVDNLAEDGGGIGTANGARSSIRNTTLAGNAASNEGGGLRLGGPTRISFATIADNHAATGGGIRVPSGGLGAVHVRASIVAGNRAGTGRQCAGEVGSLGSNLEQGHRCGFDVRGDLRNADPMLRGLGANGGPTPTKALHRRSPAVDLAGDCASRDQRGAPRDRRCDTGAYELVRCLGRPVNIVGTPGADELSGGRGPDAFLGLGGGDEFQGSIGRDLACGGPGDDLLIAGPGDDRFDGQAGDDRVRGEEGRDRVRGGAGHDRLVGGPGVDTCEADRRDRDPRGCERLVSVGPT
jgi:CSLREA domain-containing protein